MIVRSQLPVPEFRSPKLLACATRVAAQRHCGHIIFVESTAVQAWMREVLVQLGIPRERIAVLNASVKPAERVRIAREFNGLPPEPPQSAEGCALRGGTITELAPKYDVIIANSVAYEGIDLQVRTCTIHHLDLPWTPSDLEQRNGRAHRQGNRMDTIGIVYYMSKRSMDGYKLAMVLGKANWLGAVLESGNRDTNNPAAQQNLSADQILLMISRDPEETARRIAAVQAEAAAEERLRVAREAARLMQQANARFRDARATTEPEKAAHLRADGMVRLRQLRKYDAQAWPWARWIDEVERVEYLVPPDGEAPVYEGLRVAIPDEYRPDAIRYYEFGRLIASQGPPCIGVRTARSARWVCKNLEAVKGLKIRPEHLPGGSVPWDAEDETSTAAAVDEWLAKWSQDTPVSWEELGWTSAGDVWLGRFWPRAEPRVRETLAVQAEPQTVPVLVDGALRLRAGPEVRGGVLMPPTLAGWQQFLALAPTSGATFTDLRKAGELWWARRIPQTLLAAARAEEEASPETSTPATGPEPPTTRAPQAAAPAPEPRPSVDDKVLDALQKKLRIPAKFTLDGRVYARENRDLRRDDLPADGELVRVYKADVRRGEEHAPRLRLYVTPRDSQLKAVDLRGEMVGGTGRVSGRFEGKPMSLVSLEKLSSETLAVLFQITVQSGDEDAPEPALDPSEPWETSFVRRFGAGLPYRVSLVRKSGVGLSLHTYALYRESESPERAVASLDLHFDDDNDWPTVEEIRWLDDRVRPGERERIRVRIEEAVRPVGQRSRDLEEADESPLPPMQLMVELLEQQTRALRGKPAPEPTTAEERRGVQGLAQMLGDLADPISVPSEFLTFLEAHERKKAAALLASYITAPDMALDNFIKALWDALVADMQVHMTGLDKLGRVVIRRDLVHETDEGRYVFALLDRGTKDARIERISLPEPLGEDGAVYSVRHAYPFGPRMTLFADVHEDATLLGLGGHMQHLRQSLRDAPVYLADVRRALQLAGHLIDTVGCQGETRRQTQRALAEAKAFYNVARGQLVEGRTAGALERIRLAMERIALAAIELSRSCAEGQQTMPGVDVSLPVAPADRRLLDSPKEDT